MADAARYFGVRSSPRPWGCFRLQRLALAHLGVVPTPVGVFPATSCCRLSSGCRPHARGGVSYKLSLAGRLQESSPRPWGCFPLVRIFCANDVVVPTPVGVFPLAVRADMSEQRRPHARGGVSGRGLDFLGYKMSSPRPWGCFHGEGQRTLHQRVVPTPVGVFLSSWGAWPGFPGRPHARGGVSLQREIRGRRTESSPRPWGCFQLSWQECLPLLVVPTPVGVFPP